MSLALFQEYKDDLILEYSFLDITPHMKSLN